jgi:hypothetical protein
VISTARPSFSRALAALDPPAREAVRRPYRLFAADPGHPSLRSKKLAGREDVWSVRIKQQYRAVRERHAEKVVWFWIGSHNEFDHLFN